MQVLRSSPRKLSNESLDSGSDQPLTVIKSRKSHRNVIRRRNQDSINNSNYIQTSKGQSRNLSTNTVSSETQNPVTPKPRRIPSSRRSSSAQVEPSLSPTFLTRLRSLSNRRNLSSKSARPRYGMRVPSSSSDGSIFRPSNQYEATQSWDRSPNSAYADPPSLSEFGSRSVDSSFLSNSFADIQTPDNNIPDPYILAPHISIIPESKTLIEGQSSIWAVIKVSAQLFHPHTHDSSYDLAQAAGGPAPFVVPTYQCDIGLLRYGYLYNVKVDILPIAESSIIDVIGNTPTTTLTPGSSFIKLAHIRLGASKARQANRSKRDPSDLMADLESQLGSSQAEYMQVRLSYRHSGFPSFGDFTTDDSVSTYQTRLETVVTGVVKRHNSTSLWSPQPAPRLDPLFSAIISHWEPAQANNVMHQVMMNRFGPRSTRGGWSEDIIQPPSRTGTAPPIPQRQGSLRRLSPEKIMDPARKIWTELRRTSSSNNRPTFNLNKAHRFPAATTFVDAPNPGKSVIRPDSMRQPPESSSSTEVQRQREMIRDTAVRNRRSIGADSLKSLVPSVGGGSSIDGKENRSSNISDSPSPRGKKQEVQVQADRRKKEKEGRWSLGNWW